jgi:formate C-acetyltransferase
MYLESQHRPFPLLSLFIWNCIEQGVNVSQGGALYNFAQPEAVGIPNVVDGLAAIRVLVEDKGRYTLDDFRAAVRANFEGHESLRQAILRDCPKHGNDVRWVNELFGDVAGVWCSAQEGHRHLLGGTYLPGFLAWVSWFDLGENTLATPDGRLSGTPLANCITNCTGSPAKGFPALVLSTLELDHSRGLGGITMNARFQADALNEDKGAKALQGLLEGAFDLGAFQIQADLTSSETLRSAQERPDDYPDLFVRIGGYLVPFTCLPEHAQNEVIGRAEFGL